MADTRILILGDSTSMTVGLDRQTYPFHLAGAPRWPEQTTFVNASLPGFTSADACAFFFQFGKHLVDVQAVIIFVGHCDTNATELPKGRYTPFRQWRDAWRNRWGLSPKRTSLKNRLTPFEWNATYDAALETPEDPADFEYNLRRVLESSRRRDIQVVLVRPEAHRLFPPGVGKGNFIFYRYLGMRDRLSSTIKIADDRFLRASALHDEGHWGEAMSLYHAILQESGPLSNSPEYLLMVSNNYAVAAAEAGQHAEAQTVLELLLEERGARLEICLYNLAQLSKRQGDLTSYQTRLDQAYEADTSLYRIRQPYLDLLDRLAKEFAGSVRFLQMKEIVTQTDFVDHCHLLPEKQQSLAQAIGDALGSFNIRGSATAGIENRLFNPELASGNQTEFYTYFKTFAPYTTAQIQQGIQDVENAPKEMRYAQEYFLKHPFFTRPKDIAHYHPWYASDVGRFPEYFIIRLTIPYLRQLERIPHLHQAFNNKHGLLRRAADLLRILPPAAQSQVETSDPAIDVSFEAPHLDALLKRVRLELQAHIRRGPQVDERMKTTLYWYFRETLRFGAHSRVSMRYDRLPLEFLAEALAMALVIDRHLGGDKEQELRQLIGILEDIASIHERHASGFSLQASQPEWDQRLQAYASELQGVADKVQSSAQPVLCVS
jgi:hypothetical protein